MVDRIAGPEQMEQAWKIAQAAGVSRRQFLKLVAGMAGTAALGAGLGACAPASTTPLPTAAPEPVLKVGLDDLWGETMDPLVAANQVGPATMLSHVFEPGIELDPDTGDLRPGIIKKWQIAPDGLTWTLSVRDDVVFHDGSKLTADDVAFSYQRACSADNINNGGKWQAILGDNPRIEIVDQSTLKVYTNGPQPTFPTSSTLFPPLLLLYPKTYIGARGKEYFAANPIGTGPYRVVQVTHGDSIEYRAVDYKHWTGVVPEFKRVVTYLVPEETTKIAMMEAGKLDAIQVSLEGALKLKGEGFTVLYGDESVAKMTFSGAYHPLAKGMPVADVRVRQALSLAINREEIIDTMFHGIGSGTPPPDFVSWDRPDVSAEQKSRWKAWALKAFRYDPAEAKRLIAEAGYGPGGKSLTFDFWNVPDAAAPFLMDVMVACAGYWEEVGAHANMITADKAAFNAVRHTTKSTQLVGKGSSKGSPLFSTNTILLFTNYTSKLGSMDWLVGSPDQAEFDKLLAAGTTEMDQNKSYQILDRMIEIASNSWVDIPILTSPVTYAVGPRVKAYFPPGTRSMAQHYADWKYTGVEPRSQ